jgi:pimeloyl-ACP methyl ester carboxylesterase
MRDKHRVSYDVGPVRIVGDAYGDPASPPVLLLHGGGQTRHAWGGTAAALAAAGRHAISLDLRAAGARGGGGESPSSDVTSPFPPFPRLS